MNDNQKTENRVETDGATASVQHRRMGQRVRVAEVGDRHHGTIGVVCAIVPAFGTILYRVQTDRVKDYGEMRNVRGWECLFFPDQLRAAAS